MDRRSFIKGGILTAGGVVSFKFIPYKQFDFYTIHIGCEKLTYKEGQKLNSLIALYLKNNVHTVNNYHSLVTYINNVHIEIMYDLLDIYCCANHLEHKWPSIVCEKNPKIAHRAFKYPKRMENFCLGKPTRVDWNKEYSKEEIEQRLYNV